MQTPLIEFIQWLNQEDLQIPFAERWTPFDDIFKKATELLENEREVIIDSYNYGRYDGEDGNISQFKSGQDYFTKTFTDESK